MSELFYIVAVFAVSFICSAHAVDDTTMTIRAGEKAQLTCVYPDDGQIFGVTWDRSNLEPYTKVYAAARRCSDAKGCQFRTFQHVTYQGRVWSVSSTFEEKVASIVIDKTTPEDSGTYHCRVSVWKTGVTVHSEIFEQTVHLFVLPAENPPVRMAVNPRYWAGYSP